jgi:CRISPR-associated protein Csd1
MILQSLVEFSRREGLVQDPAFEYAGVTWAIEVGPDGSFWELHDLRVDSGGKTQKRVPRQMLVPRSKRSGTNPPPRFLVDNAEFVLALGVADAERLERRRTQFVAAIQSAVNETKAPELQPVLEFLASPVARSQCIAELQQKGFASNDLFCFRVDGIFLHDLESVKSHWKKRTSEAAAATGTQQCLLCGNPASPARLHPNVKGLIGASTSGVPMVSFNKDAFESYGWAKNQNANVCEECAAAYATALNRCLSSQFPDPRDSESRLTRQAYVLTENLTAVYWSEDSSSGIENLANAVVSDPDRARALLEAPYKGAVTSRPLRFHCLLLQGATGRATVRSYNAELIPHVQDNVRNWFAQTAVRSDRALSLPQMLAALAIQRKYMKLPPGLSGEIYLAILFGRQIPLQAIQLAVRRNLAEAAVADGRAAIIQAWIARKPQQKERKPLLKLDPDYPSIGYQLGRLLAVCEQIQYRATDGKVNKSLTDRFFPGLSTRPAVVFLALIKLTKTRLAQIRRRNDSNYLEKSLGDIVSKIGPGDLPPNLSLEEQAKFALGYYHERQARFSKSDAATPADDTSASEPDNSEFQLTSN